MNRLLNTIISAVVLIAALTCTAHAANGDIAGQYYSTDIKTYVNGYEIDSINIGGQTLIKAEDMKYFSFRVDWEEDTRRLFISETEFATNGAPPTVNKPANAVGTVLGDYYETDIVTYLDNNEITAYNTGGTTYIWAEQMRDFGYEVIWNENDRTLKVTSPKRAGYEYSVFLSQGSNPWGADSSGNFYDASKGAFSILWKDGKITAKGDANLFNTNLSYDGINYKITVAFYQNQGLFYSDSIQDSLQKMIYQFRDTYIAEPEDLYGYINENAVIKINGHTAHKTDCWEGGGNGHIDYYFTIYDLPQIKESELTEIEFSVGDTSGMEEYAVERTIYPDEEKRAAAMEAVVKSPEDHAYAFYEYEKFYLNYVHRNISWGVYKDALYTVDKETLTPSGDILEQVRQVTGFHYDNIHPNNAYVGDVKTNLFFSCATAWKTGDFYYDTLTGKVHTVATRTHFLPQIPDTGRKYFVVYKEGYRDNRVELAVFDVAAAPLTMDGKVLGAEGYANDIKYYLDGDKWVEFERGYERVSNNAAEIIDGNIDVRYTAE